MAGLLALGLSLLVAPLCSAWVVAPHLEARVHKNPQPVAVGDAATGYSKLPRVVDYNIHLKFPLDKSKGIYTPLYQSTGKDQKKIKRAIIVMPGKLRDCWYYANNIQNALYIAKKKLDVNPDEISLMAPCFMNEVDVGKAIPKDTLVFDGTTWISGHDNAGPNNVKGFGSFSVLDSLVDYYMDKEAYPDLEQVVVAGHSAGGQTAQRYAALRTTEKNDDRLHYWVGNPGSLLWLTEDRPFRNMSCDGVDTYKYGLSDGIPAYALGDVNSLKRDGVVDRYLGRQVHYAWGTADLGNGDTRCQAMTQGRNHYQRGLLFVSQLKKMGGIPKSQTVDYIHGVAHDCEDMFNSDEGLNKLFVYS
ncbi:hypothetical protein DL96DRAFT_1589911 [Flagelloscypha sp. PMI_526]|nr:hypothetical protein DL96DRAFT_1589911 [Flagelloscypha sp. PMI_526]